MHFTKKTFYALGAVCALLNIVGGLLLVAGTYAGLLYNMATLGTGGMMLYLAARISEKKYRYTALIGEVLLVLSLRPDVIGIVCAALAWPLFAVPYWQDAAPNTACKTAAGLVLAAGVVHLVGSFVAMPDMVRIVLSVLIAAAQGVLAWVLYQEAE